MQLLRNARFVPPQLLGMKRTDLPRLNREALDPASSVVIEACAGSGKTWLLVSRIVRLLLEGAEPSQILAVTFTRKAAQEMATRLRDWLYLLAAEPDDAVRTFLRERAIADDQIDDYLPRARRLYELLLVSQPSITITTFHSWFMQLLRRAPLDGDAPGDVTLVEQTAALIDEAWERFAGTLSRETQLPAADGLSHLFRECGLDNTRRVLMNFVRRRAEWWTYTCEAEDPVAYALAQIAAGMTAAPDVDVAADLLGEPEFAAMLGEYAEFLARNTASDQALAEALQGAPAAGGREGFEHIWPVFFTASTGTLRIRKPSGAQAKRLTPGGESDFLALHVAIGERLQAVREALRDQDSYRFNEAAMHCGVVLLDAYQSLKRERQVMDHGDVEWQACRLLRVSDHAAYMHCKLDARYRHILVDEVQDTNPLQWLALQGWFEAAADADARPTVFMVGDPKQSIYRFRRAEARLFGRAQEYLQQEFGARRLAQNESRRCAAPVIDVVNQLFGAEPDYAGFAEHVAHHAHLPGRVEVLPLAVAAVVSPPAADGDALRNPLDLPLHVEEDRRREDEAVSLAARVSAIVGSWQLDDGRGGKRPARCADIMILVRRRTHLSVYERALRDAGIPFVTSRLGGLLDTLEAQDLMALLRFLSSPYGDLDLAHALRSPVFGASDHDLIAIAGAGEGSWWERLSRMTQAGACSATLARAHELLVRWRTRADRTPVHDLLDRIYFEGGVLRRYAQAVPAAMRGAVDANLHAFMQHALDTDAGRYPSLPRFIHELADLRSAPVEEAPDEGIIGDAGDALRIYTVHGAKGLEAPIVWLLDTAAGQDGGRGYDALIDWPPEEERPAHFSLWTRKDAQSTAERVLAENEAGLAAREDLNLLYVAMTRARQALIVSGVDGRGSDNSWYARIRAATCALAGDADAAVTVAHGADLAQGGGTPVVRDIRPVPAAVDERLTRALKIGRRTAVTEGAGVDFGTHFHWVMERLTAHPDVKPDALRRDLGLSARAFEPLWHAARGLIDDPQLSRFFRKEEYVRALNEVSYVDAAGDVRRIDRMVEFDGAVWVLDYKTGDMAEDATLLAAYQAQIAEYRDVVSRMYPARPVHAALVFTGGMLHEIAPALPQLATPHDKT